MNQTSDPGCLGCLGNIIWLLFGGLWLAITAAELAALAVSVTMFITKDKVFHYRKA